MITAWTLAVLPGVLLWLAVLVLPWQPWRIRERLEPRADAGAADLSDITVIIPARDEAEVIGRTLDALGRQGRGLKVVMVDDASGDATVTRARAAMPGLEVISTPPLPPQWSGKLWALEQGRRRVDRSLVLLLDADIELAPGMIAALRDHQRRSGAALCSLMAWLPTGSFWERLLLPPFVYFFKLLYPFHLANRGDSRVAAAAGGCMLIESRVLARIGGFAAISDALIDDCALAGRVKGQGLHAWIGLSHGVRSRRPCPTLAAIWSMVARNAYTQLRYSTLMLLLCTLLMIAAFCLPLAGLAVPDAGARLLGGTAMAAMAASYIPTLRFYGLNPLWALTLPAAGVLYMAMTWTSAWAYWRGGVRSQWKGRRYPADRGGEGQPS